MLYYLQQNGLFFLCYTHYCAIIKTVKQENYKLTVKATATKQPKDTRKLKKRGKHDTMTQDKIIKLIEYYEEEAKREGKACKRKEQKAYWMGRTIALNQVKKMLNNEL